MPHGLFDAVDKVLDIGRLFGLGGGVKGWPKAVLAEAFARQVFKILLSIEQPFWQGAYAASAFNTMQHH